jgi:enoyl-CoA hydratase/carnithine racemase
MTSDGLVIARRHGPVGHLVLNQPDTRNALTVPMRETLYRRLAEMTTADGLRAIVLSGAGPSFCAGGDLSGLRAQSGVETLCRQFDDHALLRLMAAADIPLIGAVEGLALGPGLSLALACDIVVAGRDARFGAVLGKVGLTPDLGLSWTLPRRVGLGRARLMTLTGRLIAAETAEAWGLVDELVEAGEAVSAASLVAGDIAATAPLSTRLARRMLAHPFAGLDQAMDFEAMAQAVLSGTEDFAEGHDAAHDHRAPVFKGV